jgi:apolipoprotein N-acyltransferase
MYRAWRGATRFVESIYGVLLMTFGFAFVGAFFVLPAKNTWAERAVTGLAVAAIAIVLIIAAAFMWHLVTYLRTRGHDRWIVQARVGDSRVEFCLEPKNLSQYLWGRALIDSVELSG